MSEDAAADDDDDCMSQSSPMKKRKTTSYVFIFAPGAGGVTAKVMLGLHQQLEAMKNRSNVVVNLTPRWNRYNAGSASNTSAVVEAANEAALEYPGHSIVLCGASFGGRVVAETMTKCVEQLADNVMNKIVLFGYPLIDTKNVRTKDARAAHLLNLPQSVNVLFVEGELDPYLGDDDMSYLNEIIEKMNAECCVHVVKNGIHTLPQCRRMKTMKKTQKIVNKEIISAVLEWLGR